MRHKINDLSILIYTLHTALHIPRDYPAYIYS